MTDARVTRSPLTEAELEKRLSSLLGWREGRLHVRLLGTQVHVMCDSLGASGADAFERQFRQAIASSEGAEILTAWRDRRLDVLLYGREPGTVRTTWMRTTMLSQLLALAEKTRLDQSRLAKPGAGSIDERGRPSGRSDGDRGSDRAIGSTPLAPPIATKSPVPGQDVPGTGEASGGGAGRSRRSRGRSGPAKAHRPKPLEFSITRLTQVLTGTEPIAPPETLANPSATPAGEAVDDRPSLDDLAALHQSPGQTPSLAAAGVTTGVTAETPLKDRSAQPGLSSPEDSGHAPAALDQRTSSSGSTSAAIGQPDQQFAVTGQASVVSASSEVAQPDMSQPAIGQPETVAGDDDRSANWQALAVDVARSLGELLSGMDLKVHVSVKILPSPNRRHRLIAFVAATTPIDWPRLSLPLVQHLRSLALAEFADAVILGQQVTAAAAIDRDRGEEPSANHPDWALRVSLATPQQMLRQWGRWGDVQAIARLIDRTLGQVPGVVGLVSAEVTDATLRVSCLLDPIAPPAAERELDRLVTLLSTLKPQGLRSLRLEAALEGGAADALWWREWCDLPGASDSSRAESTLTVARSGDLAALAFLLERQLNPNLDDWLATGGLRVRLLRRSELLHIMVDGPWCPQRETTVEPLVKLVKGLQIPGLTGIRIYGRVSGQKAPQWQMARDFGLRFGRSAAPGSPIDPADALDATESAFGSDLASALGSGLESATTIDAVGEGKPVGAGLAASLGAIVLLDRDPEPSPAPTRFDQWREAVCRPLLATGLWTMASPGIDRLGTDSPEEDDRSPIAQAQTRGKTWGPTWSQTRSQHLGSARIRSWSVAGWFVAGVGLVGGIDRGLALLNPTLALPHTAAPLVASIPPASAKTPPIDPSQNSSILLSSASELASPQGTTTPVFPTFNSPQIDRQLTLYQQFLWREGVPDVLVVGSSRALRGVDPARLSDRLAQNGHRRLKVFNFSINGATARVVETILLGILPPEQWPRLVLWVDGTRAFNSGRLDTTQQAMMAAPAYRLLQQGTFPKPTLPNNDRQPGLFDQALAPVAAGSSAKAAGTGSAAIALVSTREVPEVLVGTGLGDGLRRLPLPEDLDAWLQGMISPWTAADDRRPANRELARSFLQNLPMVPAIDGRQGLANGPIAALPDVIRGAKHYLGLAVPTGPHTTSGTVDRLGFLPLTVKYNPKTYYKTYPLVPGDFDTDYRNFDLGGEQARSLTNLLKAASSFRRPIVFINAPLTQDYLDTYRSQRETEFNRVMAAQPWIYRDKSRLWVNAYDRFSDPSHLNRDGAEALTEAIATDPAIPWPD